MNYFNFSYQFFCVLARFLPAPMKIRKRACFKMNEQKRPFYDKNFWRQSARPLRPLENQGAGLEQTDFFMFPIQLSILIGRPWNLRGAGGLLFCYLWKSQKSDKRVRLKRKAFNEKGPSCRPWTQLKKAIFIRKSNRLSLLYAPVFHASDESKVLL